MKKVYLILFALILVLSCLALPVMAEGESSAGTEETVETITAVSTTVGVAGISVLSVTIISAIVFFFKSFSKITTFVKNIANGFSSVFGKDGKLENMPQAISTIQQDFSKLSEEFNLIREEEQKKYDELKAEYNKTSKENNEYKKALTIFFIYANNINPYVKAELFKFMSGEIPFEDDIQETIKYINNVLGKAQEGERHEHPILDSMTEAQK